MRKFLNPVRKYSLCAIYTIAMAISLVTEPLITCQKSQRTFAMREKRVHFTQRLNLSGGVEKFSYSFLVKAVTKYDK